MAAQFEAEIQNSLAKLQASVAKLEQSTARAQTQMRSLGTATAQASGQASNLAGNMARAQAAAGRFGGAAGSAVGQVASLVALNPQMLAAGAIVGLLASQWERVAGAIQTAVRQATTIPATAAQIAAPALAVAGGRSRGILEGADLGGMRAAAAGAAVGGGPSAEDSAAISQAVSRFGLSREQAAANLGQFRRSAPRAGLSADQALQVAAGFGDLTPDQFAAAQASLLTSGTFLAARDAQLNARVEAARAADRTLSRAASGADESRIRAIAAEIARLQNQYLDAEGSRRFEALQSELESYRTQAGISER